ncbi:Helix-turn-helix domain-containing protein [Lentzea waywayandensis]|uniref:Helix-turn-helix domain-containing protein n=1 Tax=Lentzea waywayandensis TaxID=84724 RepID=A0A1I6EM53_9PSEU|nr:helix-turn-helix transcriptional regulator [Lentzea waywayandensis]SFR18775.1 Helix-turn-helix domain-containing protein [Lentzea waywayandensis]
MPKNFKSSLLNRAIGRALALWRRESGLSLAEVGERVGWSSAKTSMMQNALVPIVDVDVVALALVYRVSGERRKPVLLGAQRARDPLRFDLLNGDASSCVGWTYAEVEAEASYAQVVALDVLPPVIRTPEYESALRGVQVDAVSEQGHRHYGDAHRARVMRHLSEGPSLRLDLVVGASVLRRPVGGALVMADQLLRLAAFAELPGVRVWLVPDELGAFAGMTSFTLLSFREDEFEDVVYLDSLHSGTWLEAERERRPYAETFERLVTGALPADATAERLIEAAQSLKDKADQLS